MSTRDSTTRRLDADDRWPRYPLETLWTAAVVVATFAVFMATIESSWLGLTQRLFVGGVSLWVAGQSYRLYRLTTPVGDVVDAPEATTEPP